MNSGLNHTYRKDKAALLAQNLNKSDTARSVQTLLRRLCILTDSSIKKIWLETGFDDQVCLVAVGGYGRGALYPYSDIDVLLLLPSGVSAEENPVLKGQIEQFISACWDNGLEIGSSVRNLEECIQESSSDITIQTSLLEARRIVGSASLFKKFKNQYDEAMDAKAFFVSKTLELRQRHTKFENTPYSLEPNAKESPGGLRDTGRRRASTATGRTGAARGRAPVALHTIRNGSCGGRGPLGRRLRTIHLCQRCRLPVTGLFARGTP